MSEENRICPYAGLRPFSEEESLFFKGRDEHIEQATKQLGKNKFLILTGASGDGKSSLVYAGIVPNARAGFLKSKYSNWAVADFRPERSPFQNLCTSIALQLGISQVETVKSELSHGFSALVDLYKTSVLFQDEKESTWLETDEKSKTILKRKSANLLILADQFEEFFTNPENYHKGVPSSEASLVTNLLLETAQIALEQDLPIYVVITMRSDFIGQCAAFRGLPEYIGFSQFFVPRLNRKQLQEVIEEPAHLNGDKISRRLTERLIHDMVEGTDQLPILQHALNQIWKMAKDGREELDLVHYAMVGGMEGSALPSQDVQKFSTWFEDLAEKIRECYESPDLQNVLNTHANKLFNQASDYITDKHGEGVTEEDAKLVVETTFRCLTKIDNGRAVRNRMSLGEITGILNVRYLDERTIGKVLDVFREPGNTLLKPYIDDRPESLHMNNETVLDITHESLIRNWEHLGEWAAEEYSNYSTYLDFEQQLNRWIISGKSNSFLLYIGPLTYFEGWFSKVKPNVAWIARYLQEGMNEDLKKTNAEKTLADAKEFLHRSARKHWVTRTVMRYGPRRIAAVLGIIGLLVLSSFTLKNYLERRDAYVLAEIKQTTLELAGNPKPALENRLGPIIRELELGQTTIKEVISHIVDPLEKINVATGLAGNLTFITQTADVPANELDESLRIADSLMDTYSTLPKDIPTLSRLLTEANDLTTTLELRDYYSRNPEINGLMIKSAMRGANLAKYILKNQPVGFASTTELNSALEHGLNHLAFSAAEIRELVKGISPFQNPSRNEWTSKTFDKSKLEGHGFFPVYGIRFNGLYQELAYMYASLGETELALKCADTLLFYNQNYHQNDYSNITDNAANIAVYFYLNGHANQVAPFVQGYCRKKNMTEEEFYSRLLARSILSSLSCLSVEIDFRFSNISHNSNLEYGSDGQLKFFFEAYRESVNRTVSNPDARNLFLAEARKNETIFYAKRLEDAGLVPDREKMKGEFDLALELFRKVSPGYLTERLQFFSGAFTRQTLFNYPDFITWFHPWEPRSVAGYYSSGVFMEYILENGHFEEFSRTADDLKNFENWIIEYDKVQILSGVFGVKKISIQTLSNLASKLSETGKDKTLDLNMLYLELAKERMENGKTEEALVYFNKMRPEYLHEFLRAAFFPNRAFSDIASASAALMVAGKATEANRLIQSFPNSTNKAKLYAFSAKELAMNKSKSPLLQANLDSSSNEMSLDETRATGPRIQMAFALAMRGEDNDMEEANRIMKNVEEKGPGFQRMCRALSYRGYLYDAWDFIPEDISDDNRANYFAEILYGRLLATKPNSPFWEKYEERRWRWVIDFLNYDID